MLELTAADELVALEHADVLRQNGFELALDADAPAGRRVTLTAQPVSKSTVFDVKGVSPLLSEAAFHGDWAQRTRMQISRSCCTSCTTGRRGRWCGARRRGPCSRCARAGRAS